MHRPEEAPQQETTGQNDIEIAAHNTTLAVWDIPSPLAINRSSTMKVGAKCSEGCEIAGREIEVRNEAGDKVASAKIGPTPWAGTSSLYWAEMQLMAPPAEGTYSWTVRFTGNDSELPHREASSNFRFVAVRQPEHIVTIQVMTQHTEAVLCGAEVRVGFYRGSTDESGLSKIDVPKGAYELNVWKRGYELLSRSIEVADDVTVCAGLVAVPEPEDEYWTG